MPVVMHWRGTEATDAQARFEAEQVQDFEKKLRASKVATYNHKSRVIVKHFKNALEPLQLQPAQLVVAKRIALFANGVKEYLVRRIYVYSLLFLIYLRGQ